MQVAREKAALGPGWQFVPVLTPMGATAFAGPFTKPGSRFQNGQPFPRSGSALTHRCGMVS